MTVTARALQETGIRNKWRQVFRLLLSAGEDMTFSGRVFYSREAVTTYRWKAGASDNKQWRWRGRKMLTASTSDICIWNSSARHERVVAVASYRPGRPAWTQYRSQCSCIRKGRDAVMMKHFVLSTNTTIITKIQLNKPLNGKKRKSS